MSEYMNKYKIYTQRK